MVERNFEEWLGKFRASIASYEYYVDFKKVYSNVDKIKIIVFIEKGRHIKRFTFQYCIE